MLKALSVIEGKRAVLHVNADDEHVDVLADVVAELLALRGITTKLVQVVSIAQQEATTMLKNLFSS